MTNRADALQALRPARAAALPAPGPRPVSALPPLDLSSGDTDPADHDITEATCPPLRSPAAERQESPPPPPQAAPTAASPGSGPAPNPTSPFTFDDLVAEPTATCKAMTDARLSQPAKPLNVDLTPATADAFDDRCRALRIKKKDVAEVLLRAWLDASGRQQLNR